MSKPAFYFFIVTLIYCFLPNRANCLSGDIWAHDPSTIIKDGDKYWVFTTGDGINAKYSDDLYSWKAGNKTIFEKDKWPSWIQSYVPDFGGVFWAPDIIKLNNKFYLYYACSVVGSPVSVIGLATSPTLDQDSPNYKWTDEGMIVSSGATTDINAIDPAVFKDTDGKVYLTYGSFSDGIGVTELNATTGKVKKGAKLYKVAGGDYASWEAPCLIKNGSYYYLFANKARCCIGIYSTYYMVVGRSKSPTGPFLDKNGVALKGNSEVGGGTPVLISSGRYIGPGHFGLLQTNGRNLVSCHYYDGNDNGNYKLDIANLNFSNDGWPIITRDLVPAGRFKLINQNTGMVVEAPNCSSQPLQQLVGNTDNNSTCQEWDLTPVGDGYYKISNELRNQAIDVPFCNSSNGTNLQTFTWLNNNCQKFKIEQIDNGSYVITSSVNSTQSRVLQASPSAASVDLYDFNGSKAQQWKIEEIKPPKALHAEEVTTNSFTARWNKIPNATGYRIDVSTSFEDAAFTTIAGWNFEGGTNMSTSGTAENLNRPIISVGTNPALFKTEGNSGKTASATGWNATGYEKYWLINVNTTNYYNIKISSIQRSSDLGPRHFKLQYKIGDSGVFADIPGAVISTSNNYTAGAIVNAELPKECENRAVVHLRWLVVTNSNLLDSGINSSGESNIDNIAITAHAGNYVPAYIDVSVKDTSLIIKDLLPGINYYYRVRYTGNNFVSENSKAILVKTGGEAKAKIIGINAYQKNSSIEVDWNMALETDILRYEVERSVNGEWFTQLGVTQPLGSNPSSQIYHFTDSDPGVNENLYRIKLVMKWGIIQYSAVAKAIIERGKNGVFFYPNPTTGNTLQVKLFYSAKGLNRLTLYNSAGQLVYKTEVNHPGGYSVQTLSFDNYISPGLYFLVVTNGGDKSVHRIIFN